MGRLLVISNRLPFSVTQDGEKISLRQSSGGLVSAIKSYFENDKESAKSNITQKIWVGLGDFTREEWKELEPDYERKDFEVVPLFVDPDTYSDYYNGFSNSTLWPLFHYFPSLAEYNAEHFEAYKKVNELFAETLIPVIQPDDIIWIHDYQLMLLPQLIRKAFPDALIGFFLHIPFPSYEIFRLIPTEWKRSLLTGLLGADLIGFHTHDYVQYFIQSVKMVLGLDNTYNTIHYQHRLVKADLFPIGIDYAKFRDATNDKEIISIRDEIRKNFSNKKIIFSVDRLDYSKGLMDRLQGFECFLERFPEWKERVVFIVNVVPSRDSIQTYNDRKRLIEEKISIINGLNATLSWQPVIYRYNHLEFKELSALYQAADVALITPLRDGMNLVAKEYVASCTSQRGVLILSELAGAASELSEAILVNPTDVMEVSSAIQKALTMPLTEQRYRMILMQKRLMDYDVFHWVNDFFEQLNLIKAEQRKMKVKVLDSETEEILRKHYTQAKKRCILLDYDGTLSPFTRLPADAIPGADLKTLLLELASDPKNNVVVISGRDADTLERWLGKFPVSLVAEHGAQVKLNGEGWKNRISITDNWKEEIRPLLEFFVTRCAGSFIEEKRTTLAWHYRNTQPDLGFTRSRELLNSLNQLTQNTPLQIIDGNKVMEIRLTGIDKGITALSIVDQLKPDFVLCMGDDTTDEDMFKALENKGYTIKIGNGSTAAQYNILSQDKVLPLLYSLITPKTELKQEWTSSS